MSQQRKNASSYESRKARQAELKRLGAERAPPIPEQPIILSAAGCTDRVVRELVMYVIRYREWPGEDVLRRNEQGGWSYQRERPVVIERDGDRCRACARDDVERELHHVFPAKCGGPFAAWNLRLLCRRCHRRVGREARHLGQLLLNLGTAADQ